MGKVLIVGGGPAGAASACLLARAGVEVTVIEREPGAAHKICGEFLSTEAQSSLAQLGFDVSKLGGHPISRLRMVHSDQVIETALPFQGIGISRHALDEALLKHAAASGANVLRNLGVTNVNVADRIELTLSDGRTLHPETVFIATGKHELRGARRTAPRGEDLVGFKMHFRLNPAATKELASYVSLVLLRDGYAGLQLVENQQGNLCLLVKRERLHANGGRWPDLLLDIRRESPFLAHVLNNAMPMMDQPLSIYRVPYGFIYRRQPNEASNIYRLGDQAAVIPSFTGDGMAIALHSAGLASTLFLKGAGAATYHCQMAQDVSAQIGRAGILYRIASHPATRGTFFRFVRALPCSLQVAAILTRIPARARLVAA